MVRAAKVKIAKGGPDLEGLADVIDGLTGTGPANMRIVIPKCCMFRNTLLHLDQLMRVLSRLPICGDKHKEEIETWLNRESINWTQFPLLAEEMAQFDAYCAKYKLNIADNFKEAASQLMDTFEGANIDKLKNASIDVTAKSDNTEDPKVMIDLHFAGRNPDREYRAKVSAEMAAFRETPLINAYTVTMSNLLSIRLHLKNDQFAEVPSLFFIRELPGYSFTPLGSLCSFDFKACLLGDETTDSEKRFLLSFLAKTFRYTMVLTKLSSTPDIDISEYTSGVIGGLMNLRGELPRCDKAFKAIQDSASMLEDSFNSYYLSFRATNNPLIIIESYLTDLDKKNSKTSPEMVRQLRQIVNHIKKKVQVAQQSNPSSDTSKFDMLFKMFDKACGEDEAAASAPKPDVAIVDPDEEPPELVAVDAPKNKSKRGKKGRSKVDAPVIAEEATTELTVDALAEDLAALIACGDEVDEHVDEHVSKSVDEHVDEPVAEE